MQYCYSCHHLSSGSAFCPYCGKSWGKRLCKKKHASPPDADFCVECGSDKLTEATAYLPLGWLVWIIVALIFIVVWKVGQGLGIAVWGEGQLVAVMDAVLGKVVTWSLLFVLLYTILSCISKDAAQALGRGVKFVVKAMLSMIGSIFKLLFLSRKEKSKTKT